MDYNTLIQLLDSTIRLATPLLLACLAGLFSERAGIFDIGLEGKMLTAAMCSGAVAYLTGSVWIGLLAGIAGSLVFAMIHGIASITFRGNQLISGVALNFLASGLTVLVAQTLFRQGGRTPPISGDARFNPITLPGAEAIKDVPFIGPLYWEVISGHSILVYAAFAIVALTWWVLYRTRYGLRLRAVGENPAAVDTAGVSVVGLRYSALVITGILCGIAGAYMATALQAGFGKEMTAGRGYIALAALIFAKWRPVAAMWACLLFGFFQALALRPDVLTLTAAGWLVLIIGVAVLWLRLGADKLGRMALVMFGLFGMFLLTAADRISATISPNPLTISVPGAFLEALPYILTVLVLAGFIGKAIPPRAGGEPYVKER